MASLAKPNPREAALLAAEARLRGTTPAPTSSSASSPSAFTPWTPPTPQQDIQTRLVLSRILDKQIMSHHSYAVAEKGLGTLGKIVGNILDHQAGLDSDKYRDLKAKKGGMLYRDVLDLKGGEEFLVAIGFRTKTVLFEQHYILAPTPANYHIVGIARSLLEEHLKEAQSRSTHATASSNLPPSNPFSASAHVSSALNTGFGISEPPDVIAARKAEALRSIEEDRLKVKERVERERVGREAILRKQAEERARIEPATSEAGFARAE